MKRYAEDANYWDTTVSPAKSLGEIQELLEGFGADAIQTTQGQSGGRYAWLIRFQWQGRSYRFAFTPLECRLPNKIATFAGKKRTFEEQSRYQMGRIAAWFVKAILTAAEAQPEALFGYLELPAARPGAMPPIAAELDTSRLASQLNIPQLQAGEVIDGELNDTEG